MADIKRLIDITENLLFKDRVYVYKMIEKWGYHMFESSDGVRVNLDNFRPEHLQELQKKVNELANKERTRNNLLKNDLKK